MPADIPAVADLRRKAIVQDHEIAAAVDAYLADPKASRHTFASGHTIDVAQAIEHHGPSKTALAKPDIADAHRRTMVMTAVILGFPKAP